MGSIECTARHVDRNRLEFDWDSISVVRAQADEAMAKS